MTTYLYALLVLVFLQPVCNIGLSANAQYKPGNTEKKARKQEVQSRSKVSKGNESDVIPHLTNWRETSLAADKLIDQKQYEEAEDMLVNILPRARSEAPQSVDYALTLCRLSTALSLLQKYPQALARIQEAQAILNHKPSSVRQRKVAWRAMLVKISILLGMDNNVEAEVLSRKAIAYAVAFPDAASTNQLKTAYSLLNNSLEKQKKTEEAKRVSEIMNHL